ncbi:MAG: DMT family transporter [Acidimicrobiales bacterium]
MHPSSALSRRISTPMLAAVVAVVLWGIGPLFVKASDLPGFTVALYRLLIGGALMTALLYARGGRLRGEAFRASLPGGVAFGVNILFFFTAVKLTSVADATIISALQPAFLLLLVGPLFGEKVRLAVVAWTAIALGGVALVVYGAGAGTRTLLGDLLAVGALLTWVWYFVASKQARARIGALEYQASLLLVSTAVVLPVIALSDNPLVLREPRHLAVCVAVAVVPGGGHLLMNYAHGQIKLTVASLLTLATPVVATVGAAAFLSESIRPLQIVGGLIVLTSLAVVILRMAQTRVVAPDDPAPDLEPDQAVVP